MLKVSTMMKGNLCIYKCLIDVLYIFDRVFKENCEMHPIWDIILGLIFANRRYIIFMFFFQRN